MANLVLLPIVPEPTFLCFPLSFIIVMIVIIIIIPKPGVLEMHTVQQTGP